MFGAVRFSQLEHFVGYRALPANMEGVAVDRFRAPVAPVRATPAGNQVQREESVRLLSTPRDSGPCQSSLAREAEADPCRRRGRLLRTARVRLARVRLPATSHPESLSRPISFLQAIAATLSRVVLRLAQQYVVAAVLADIPPRDRVASDPCTTTLAPEARAASIISPGDLAHSRQAHLGQEIEIVFVDRDDLGAVHARALLGNPAAVVQHACRTPQPMTPRSRSTAAAYNVPSGGYGCILRTCLRSYGRWYECVSRTSAHESPSSCSRLAGSSTCTRHLPSAAPARLPEIGASPIFFELPAQPQLPRK